MGLGFRGQGQFKGVGFQDRGRGWVVHDMVSGFGVKVRFQDRGSGSRHGFRSGLELGFGTGLLSKLGLGLGSVSKSKSKSRSGLWSGFGSRLGFVIMVEIGVKF